MVRVWPQCWQAVGGPRDKMCDFVALVWPIRSLVITTSSALVRCLNFLGAPSVGYRNSWQASNLHSEQLSVGLYHGQGSPLLAGPLSRYPQCHNGLAPSKKRTWVPLSLSAQRSHDMADEWVFSIIPRTPRQPPAILSSTPQLAWAPTWPQWAVSWLAAARLIIF